MQETDINVALKSIIEDVEKHEFLFTNPSVDNGKMGLALLYFYFYKFNGSSKYLERGIEKIQESIQNLSEISEKGTYEPSYKGDNVLNVISGFGKGLLFAENRFNLGFEFDSYYKQLDDVLFEGLKKQLLLKNFDYFNGALAPAHYFLNKHFHHSDDYSKNVLIKIYNQVRKSAVTDLEHEVYWHSTAFGNIVYLGISHGSAMIINFICKMFEMGILSNQEDKEFLKKAVKFVLTKRRSKEPNGFFPDMYFKNLREEKKSQFAMCYGDLGVLFALKNASSVLKNKLLEHEVDTMLSSYAKQSLDVKSTFDAGILYGAAGVYCIFREISEKWGVSSFANTSSYWYDQILQFRDVSRPKYAGFLDMYAEIVNDSNKSAKHSFLWGISGVGINLMIGLDDTLPKINELTLLGI